MKDDGRNLSGNEEIVSEFVVLRGGSFGLTSSDLRVFGRLRLDAGVDDHDNGFRCARSNSGF